MSRTVPAAITLTPPIARWNRNGIGAQVDGAVWPLNQAVAPRRVGRLRQAQIGLARVELLDRAVEEAAA